MTRSSVPPGACSHASRSPRARAPEPERDRVVELADARRLGGGDELVQERRARERPVREHRRARASRASSSAGRRRTSRNARSTNSSSGSPYASSDACDRGSTPAVVVEAAAGLPAEPPGGDVAAQERARRVLRIAEPLVQHLHDRDARVEPDQVGERERAHRVREPELRDRVDRLRLGDALHQRVRGLVEERHQDPVRDEAREVVRLGRRLPEVAGERDDRLRRLVGGLLGPDHLDEREHRHGVEEVHPDHALGACRDGGQLRDRDRRRVRGEHRLRGTAPHRRPGRAPSSSRRARRSPRSGGRRRRAPRPA